DHVAARVERTVRSVELRREVVERIHRLAASAERLPAHADGVDLVDEDDAVAAPLAGEALRPRRHYADDHGVDADECLREAGAGDRHERRVEAGGDRLRHHRLAGAGCPEEQKAALFLTAGPLEHLTGLPERDDAPDLFLCLGLAANVLELDAP